MTTTKTTKKNQVIKALRSPKGVSLARLMATTGWQRHTVRGFISLLGSRDGIATVASYTAAGQLSYKVAA